MQRSQGILGGCRLLSANELEPRALDGEDLSSVLKTQILPRAMLSPGGMFGGLGHASPSCVFPRETSDVYCSRVHVISLGKLSVRARADPSQNACARGAGNTGAPPGVLGPQWVAPDPEVLPRLVPITLGWVRNKFDTLSPD